MKAEQDKLRNLEEAKKAMEKDYEEKKKKEKEKHEKNKMVEKRSLFFGHGFCFLLYFS